jgi:hypothetical protein
VLVDKHLELVPDWLTDDVLGRGGEGRHARSISGPPPTSKRSA